MRPSAAGPMLACPAQASSPRPSVFWWTIPPTETMFFAQACGRDIVVPALLCDCVIRMSLMNRMSSISAETVVYCVVSPPPQLFDWKTARKSSVGSTSSAVCA
jgi:hypothetical protein